MRVAEGRPRGGLAAGIRTLACLAMALGTPGCGAGSSPPAAPKPAPASFAADRLWDDGRAEIDAYEATVRRYGILRPLTAYLIVVKEDFSKTQLVKADPGHDSSDLLSVLKLNQVLDYPTGIYTYHQMLSCFFDRSTLELVKLSLASSEWCGNSYKEYTRRDGRATLHAHTYWDSQADVTYDVPAGPDVVFRDALPLWIRALPQEVGTRLSLRLLPTQIESTAARPEPVAATLRAAGAETVDVAAGRYETLRWELSTPDGAPEVYRIARAAPHLLIAWDRADGGRYRLKWSQRLPYWILNHPGDETYLEGPARATPAVRSRSRR